MPEITENKSLKSFNTFGIDVKARYFCRVMSVQDILNLLNDQKYGNLPLLILGGGSNILLVNDFPGLAIKMDIKGFEVIKENEDHIWVKSGAGELWHDLVVYSVNHNYAGIENLSLIPGTVGAAPIQNIGAYGVELKDVFDSLEAVNIESRQQESFDSETCRFGYRKSVFKEEWKGRYIITSVTLRLNKKPVINISYGSVSSTLQAMGIDDQITIKDVSDAIIKIRSEKLPDPQKIGNSGSFFKNPEIFQKQYNDLKSKFPEIPGYTLENNKIKIPAGWLIEQCGWKGKIVGHTGTYKNQALVLVNYGGATGQEIYSLSEKILESVKIKFGIELEREVNIIEGST